MRRRTTEKILRAVVYSGLVIAALSGGVSCSSAPKFKNGPLVELQTPKQSMQVFMSPLATTPLDNYMVVVTTKKGATSGFKDAQVVETIMADLNRALSSQSGRCPASTQWRYRSQQLEANYCVHSYKTDKIERAILSLMPSKK